MTREVVLDTETTGLDPKDGHRIVEIGCVELVDHFPTGKTWHRYMNPEREMPEEAFKVHGLGMDFLADKPLFKDLGEDFLEFIDAAVLVIHNASFDVGFLNCELAQADLPTIGMGRVIDTLVLARQKHPSGPNNLDALCRRYGIDNSSRILHGALLDSEILAEVYLELIGGHQAKLDLAQDPQRGVRGGDFADAARSREVPLAVRLTVEETSAHDALVKTLGEDAIWRKYS